ncbi:TIGR02444 family protein [Oceanisphaera profunda]|uniref:TIGR02444 family protein n=1 Tax=Oceanisphaera profunda TaxID=1416627 RepID=UPI001D1316E7|nr:TIGR02444 family protein [Oceanisphaera profunda]
MSIPSAEQFWQFSEQHYARAGVADACLQLQDDYGANVNLLLLLVMLEERGLTLDPTHFLPILRQRAGLFNQWRLLRRQLKAKLSTDDYLALLRHELELECWQQQELIQVLGQIPLSTDGGSGLLAYLSLLQVPDAPLWQLKLAA